MNTRENKATHVKSTVLVAVALTVAILLAVSFLIATGTRGGGALRPLANASPRQPPLAVAAAYRLRAV